MKVKIIVVLVAAISVVGLAMVLPGVEVPAAVKKAFSSKYPKVEKVNWDLEGEGEYEAEFKLNGQEMSANFKFDGSWLETETEVKKGNLPQAIKSALASQFSDYQVDGAAQLETPDQPVTYEVDLERKSDDSSMEVLFGADGTVLKKEMKKEDDEKEEKGH
jgi:outer membrane protein OmpA-like peptidoglycan-associated protein